MAETKIKLGMLDQSGATSGQVPEWDGTEWLPTTPSGGGGGSVNASSVVSSSGAIQTNSSTTWVDVNNSTVTITPTTTSAKIKVDFSLDALIVNNSSAVDSRAGLRILRGGTVVHTDSVFLRHNISGYIMRRAILSYVDEPNTTSATTYKVQFSRPTGSATVQINGVSENIRTAIEIES